MLLLLLFPLILASNIPGFPGVDYPTLASVPTTSFECNGRSGYYSDINHGCQVFHICDHSYHHSFLCPNGTIFDQISMSCQWWFNVNCDASENYYILNENLYKGKDISLYGKISNDLYNFMIDSIGISLSNEGKFQNIDKHQVLFSTNNQDGFREIPFIPKTEIYPFQSFGYFQTSNRVEKNNKNRNYKFGQYFSEPSNGPMVQKTDVNEFNNPSLFQAKIPDGNTNLGFKHLNTNTNTKTEIENFIDTVKFRTTSAPLRHQDTMQIPRLETRPKTEIILGKPIDRRRPFPRPKVIVLKPRSTQQAIRLAKHIQRSERNKKKTGEKFQRHGIKIGYSPTRSVNYKLKKSVNRRKNPEKNKSSGTILKTLSHNLQPPPIFQRAPNIIISLKTTGNTEIGTKKASALENSGWKPILN
ncbi:uncharacterized protein LOC136032952 [Artemia franciscana]|uniref:uncharacterized protein LOC136032952 n=1 Tax=Artemia franciscana TaxID=6661 RepID=UPI0032D9EEDE